MPVSLSYPGVYIQEIPSGVRTITGVATSITAFIGWASKGPTDKAQRIFCWQDFERYFGGLDGRSLLGYAVSSFFANGGSDAYIIRLVKDESTPATATIDNKITVTAKNPGKSGNHYRVSTKISLEDPKKFSLKVLFFGNENDTDEAQGVIVESFDNLSVDSMNEQQYVINVINDAKKGSAILNATIIDTPDSPPANSGTSKKLTGGSDLTATATIDDKITLTTKSPGKWGNHYRVSTKIRSDDLSNSKFRLQILYFDNENDTDEAHGVIVESFENLSVDSINTRYVINVINVESAILNATIIGTPVSPPADSETSKKLTGGEDGPELHPNDPDFEVLLTDPSGNVSLLEKVDLFNILCVPGETDPATLSKLEGYCRKRRAFLIVDCNETATFSSLSGGPSDITGDDAINAAFYFPWLKVPDPLQQNRPRDLPPCGFIAGIYSRTDANRGVFKAPAGTDASLSGISGVKEILTDMENGVLNQKGINCIRSFPVYGNVVWGARTLRGNDEIGSEWKYIPVRRLALFIEESLFRGTKWVVFEPNDEPLWSQIRLNVGAFMHTLFRQGAFQGSTPRDAYFVKCDKETTTQDDINRGIVNIVVGFAPLKPAEFVVIKIQQIAGEIQT